MDDMILQFIETLTFWQDILCTWPGDQQCDHVDAWICCLVFLTLSRPAIADNLKYIVDKMFFYVSINWKVKLTREVLKSALKIETKFKSHVFLPVFICMYFLRPLYALKFFCMTTAAAFILRNRRLNKKTDHRHIQSLFIEIYNCHLLSLILF